jgi:hypothetical protein
MGSRKIVIVFMSQSSLLGSLLGGLYAFTDQLIEQLPAPPRVAEALPALKLNLLDYCDRPLIQATDQVFHMTHPELEGRQIDRTETQLVQEWLATRAEIQKQCSSP